MITSAEPWKAFLAMIQFAWPKKVHLHLFPSVRFYFLPKSLSKHEWKLKTKLTCNFFSDSSFVCPGSKLKWTNGEMWAIFFFGSIEPMCAFNRKCCHNWPLYSHSTWNEEREKKSAVDFDLINSYEWTNQTLVTWFVKLFEMCVLMILI